MPYEGLALWFIMFWYSKLKLKGIKGLSPSVRSQIWKYLNLIRGGGGTILQKHLKFEKYRKAKYVQRRVCFVNLQSSLHENVVFSVCALMCNAAYVIYIMWNFLSGLDAWYHFRLNSCGVAVTVRSYKKKSGYFLRGGKGGMFLRDRPIFEVVFNF